MRYSKVFVEAIGYELPPTVVTSAELESRLEPAYRALHVQPGQLEALTGISERRWWAPDTPLSEGASRLVDARRPERVGAGSDRGCKRRATV